MSKYKRTPSTILALATRAEEERKAKAKAKAKRASARASRPYDGGQHHQFDPAQVFQNELSDLKEGSSEFAWACCPFHDDHNPSFCVNLQSGWYKCFASHCGETGWNIVGFVSALHGLNYSEARKYLEANYG